MTERKNGNIQIAIETPIVHKDIVHKNWDNLPPSAQEEIEIVRNKRVLLEASENSRLK